jgi:uncharacterized protein (DUF433 family)
MNRIKTIQQRVDHVKSMTQTSATHIKFIDLEIIDDYDYVLYKQVNDMWYYYCDITSEWLVFNEQGPKDLIPLNITP